MSSYPNLFSPLAVRGLRFPNRIVRASLSTELCETDGSVTEAFLTYYARHAAGGAGLVMTEFASVDAVASRSFPRQLGCDRDRLIPGLTRLTRLFSDTKTAIGIQLCHAGSQTRVIAEPRVASAEAVRDVFSKARSLSVAEIHDIIESFVKAAKRAREAGFDVIEIHGGHGFLLGSFLSPRTNRRQDAYGGDFAGRSRFVREVVEAVRAEAGVGAVLSIRLNGDDLEPGGLALPESTLVAQVTVKAGIDLVHVSAGTHASTAQRITPVYAPRGNLTPLAIAIRKAIGVPVIASGGLSEPERLEALIASGDVDMVSMARALHADPDWPNKVKLGKEWQVRPCIRANRCLSLAKSGNPPECDVNPFVIGFAPLRRAAHPKHVAVIGGGPAGLQATLVATERGHRVTLFDEREELGGTLHEAGAIAAKGDLRSLRESLVRSVEEAGVEVRLGIRMEKSSICANGYDAIVVAVGARPYSASLPGVEETVAAGRSVVDATQVLVGHRPNGPRLIVVGGGVTGCETAVYLAERGFRPTVVEAESEIVRDLGDDTRASLERLLAGHDVTVCRSTRALRVSPRALVVMKDGTVADWEYDAVVVAVGYRPNSHLAYDLRKSGVPVYTAGNCTAIGRIGAAIRGGTEAALSL